MSDWMEWRLTGNEMEAALRQAKMPIDPIQWTTAMTWTAAQVLDQASKAKVARVLAKQRN